MFMGMNREELLRFNTLEYQAILNQRIINYMIEISSEEHKKEINKIIANLKKEMENDKSYQSLKKEVKENPFSCIL